ncbi:hypothetical protein HUW51_12890 [Adhaeribacter swui]|uniref:Seryl-tRNA synthetase n=1 Tax=Adhaeribacter swui TaxID=2086471 RepID=A0A7G7G8T9_9BACT|nr:hypothetical protein [Adhaeribacter swui]QNF33573.1 hypothetical protein HUW51_12890 [Adhaeribacter swui]
MKNLIRPLVFSVIIFLASAGAGMANDIYIPNKKNISAQQEQRLLEIQARLDEIKALDKSKLTKADRKDLRAELTELKKEARRGGGIYLSTGAVVIIVLLLILLL